MSYKQMMRCEAMQKVVSLRSRGRYQEALNQLETTEKLSDDISRLGERALTYTLQHRFGEILQLLQERTTDHDEIHSESKNESFIRMLRDFAGIHAELKLREAVISSEVVASRWLVNRENQEYDRLDVYMIALYARIQTLGKIFLSDMASDMEHASETMVRTMNCYLLGSGRFEEVVIVHTLEFRHVVDLNTVLGLRETLRRIECYHTDVAMVNEDLRAHICLLLYEASLLNDERDEKVTTDLQGFLETFERTGNVNRKVWAQFYLILHDESRLYETGPLGDFLGQFVAFDDWRGVQMCSTAIAKILQKKNEYKMYTAALLGLLDRKWVENPDDLLVTKPTRLLHPLGAKQSTSHALGVPTADDSQKRRREESPSRTSIKRHRKDKTVASNQNTPPPTLESKHPNPALEVSSHDADNSGCALLGNGSMLNFWQSYLDFLSDDSKDERFTGSVIAVSSRFFEKHPQCSIHQLQFLFAMTITECYEKLGHAQFAISWVGRALKFAEAEGDEDMISEANYYLEHKIAGGAVSISRIDAETEAGRRKFTRDRMGLLEILYEEAGTDGHHRLQYDLAKDLLAMQLSTEAESARDPVGEPWLSRTRQALEELSDNEQEIERAYVDFTIAHAKFEYGDYDAALGFLEKVIDSSGKSGNHKLRSGAFFTKGRVHLHIYLKTHDDQNWSASTLAIQASSEISAQLQQFGPVACCHTLLATLWKAKIPKDPNAAARALSHIEGAENLWHEETKNIDVLTGHDGILSRYSLRHRNVENPYDIFGTAFSVCFENSDFTAAWRWAQRAKACAFRDSLRLVDTAAVVDSGAYEPALPEMEPKKDIVYVHWVTAGEVIYMLTCRPGQKPLMFRLDIALSAVTQWYSDLVDTQEDLSDAESAEEILEELNALVEPLGNDEVSAPGELLVLCPTKLLFKIPLHALSVGDQCLLSRNPVLYSHVMPPQGPQRQSPGERRTGQIALFGNPTGDTLGGEESVAALSKRLGPRATRVFTNEEATKEAFINHCQTAHLVHYHGHVSTQRRALLNSMILHEGVELQAKDVLSLDLHKLSPLVCLIGCGSGTQLLWPGDEPLGFIPVFLYAGAASVVGTMWPIHDTLSGAAFTEVFYELFEGVDAGGVRGPVDLAVSLQKAALAIRARDETRAPYFWAGFVLHGEWSFEL